MKIKKLFHRSVSLLLAVLLAIALPVTSFALEATPSEAYMDTDSFDTIDYSNEIMLSSSADTLPVVYNTVDYSGVKVRGQYRNSNGSYVYTPYYSVGSDGYFSVPKPSDYVEGKVNAIEITFRRASLPAYGNYTFKMSYRANAGGSVNVRFPYEFVRYTTVKEYKNQSSVSASGNVDFQQDSNDFNITANCSIYCNYWTWNILTSIDDGHNYYMPFSGTIKASFAPYSGTDTQASSMKDSYESSGGSSSEFLDNTSQIADNTAAIIEGQDTIIETIKEQIQYIIFQIQAFWNQLASEFTNLYNKMNEHHQEDLEKVDEQIENDNSNTEKVVNGYDNSSINSDNDRLKDTLGEYDAEEGKVMENVNDSINSFDFDTDFDSYLKPIKTVSDFLQALYENSGGFKAVINVAFAVTIASLVIGIYRFKGGG